MNQELDLRNQNIKEHIINKANAINQEINGLIDENTLNKGILEFTSTKYDLLSLEEIYQIIDSTIQKLLLEKKEKYNKYKYEELKNKYLMTKDKYGNQDYTIMQIDDNENIISYNKTKKVLIQGNDGINKTGFYKGSTSPNEYELLV